VKDKSKAGTVEALRRSIDAQRGAVVAEFRGLTVAEMTALRKKLREVDAEFRVVKNTLIRLAAKDTGFGGLDEFFSALPREGMYAVELRNEEFLTPMYFAVLREHGVAHVFNSWTRMPPIGDQLDLPGAVSGPFLVARALLRPGRSYDEAVDAFAPYDRILDPSPPLRRDLVRLIETAVHTRIPAYLLVNNRAEGSAPLTVAEVLRMLPPAGA